MKTIEEMLLNLARPEVVEFGLVSNRLPSVNVGGKFEPVDNRAPTTDMVLQMLVTMGGSRYVESLSPKPTQWTTRLEGVGVVAIAAIMRDEIVQARFTVARRDGPKSGQPMSAPGDRVGPAEQRPPHAAAVPSSPPATSVPQPSAPPARAPMPSSPGGAAHASAPPQPPPPPHGVGWQPPVGTARGAPPGVPQAWPAPQAPPPTPAVSTADDEFDDDDELTVQTVTPTSVASSRLPSEPAPPPTLDDHGRGDVPRPKPPRSEDQKTPSVTNIQAVAPAMDFAPTAPQPQAAPPTPAPPSQSTAVDAQSSEGARPGQGPLELAPPSEPTHVQITAPISTTNVQQAPPSLTTVHAHGPGPHAMPARRAAPAPDALLPPEAASKEASSPAVSQPSSKPPEPERHVFNAKDTQKIPTPTRVAGLSDGVALSNVGGAIEEPAPPSKSVIVTPAEELSEADATDPTIDIVVEQQRGRIPANLGPLPAMGSPIGAPPPGLAATVVAIAPPPGSVTPAIAAPMSQPASTDRGGPYGSVSPAEPSADEAADAEAATVGEHVVTGPAPTDPTSLETHLHVVRQLGASDVYLVSDRPAAYRVATDVMPKGSAVPADALARIVRQAVPARLNGQLELEGSCDFTMQHVLHGRFRANVSRQRTGWKMALRAISKETPTLASLGLPETLAAVAGQRRGLVLVTGPAGHGKTSSVAALVDVINRVSCAHVLTVEAPIEYVHARKRAIVSQREVGQHARSFARAIAASVREDVDVVVAGDLRDAPSIREALLVAESGRLVIATMCTPSAARTVDVILDLFPRSEQPLVRAALASTLRLILGQRLVPSSNRTRVYVACELLPASPALYVLVRDGKTAEIATLQQRGRSVVRLDDSLAELVRSGKVTSDTAKFHAEAPGDLDALVSGADRRTVGAGQKR